MAVSSAGSCLLPPSLDPLETSDQLLLTQEPAQQRIHARFSAQRSHTLAALFNDPDRQYSKRVNRMLDCCRYPTVGISSNGAACLQLGRCRDRLCPLCAKSRGLKSESKIKEVIAIDEARRLMTLTIISTGHGLHADLDHLFYSFKQLRKSKAWTEHVRGGVWACEITLNTQTGRWHPHLHICYAGTFFPQATLSALWLKITGDSKIVDVRFIHEPEKAAKYLAKYLGTPDTSTEWTEDQIREYARATHGRRAVGAFGISHARECQPRDDETPSLPPTKLGSPEHIRERARRDPTAVPRLLAIVGALGGKWSALFNTPSTNKRLSTKERTHALLVLGALLIDITRPVTPTPQPPRERTHQLQLIGRPP